MKQLMDHDLERIKLVMDVVRKDRHPPLPSIPAWMHTVWKDAAPGSGRVGENFDPGRRPDQGQRHTQRHAGLLPPGHGHASAQSTIGDSSKPTAHGDAPWDLCKA